MSSIKLEVGKKYELNNGEVHQCTYMYGVDLLAVNCPGYGPFVLKECLYHQDGTFADRNTNQEYLGVKRCVDDGPKLWRDMTSEEKGALLLAHHEGKTIEFFSEGYKSWFECTPVWDDNSSYRVKPGPVVKVVSLYSGRPGCGPFGPKGDRDTHSITFNVIDGKPDCASVKMEKLK